MVAMCETKHSMLRRCRDWDYRQPCIYQITFVLAERRSQALGRLNLGLPPQAQDRAPMAQDWLLGQVLGRGAESLKEWWEAKGWEGQVREWARFAEGRGCTVRDGAVCSVPEAADSGFPVPEAAASSYIALSPAGEAVLAEFLRIGEHHPEIKPLFMQVMPDHVHFIIKVERLMGKPLGNAIGGFKAGSSKAAIGGPGLWAEGFHDTILFHEGQLDAMFSYLKDNPRRLAMKRLAPVLFQVQRDLCLALPRQAQSRMPMAQGRQSQAPEAQACGLMAHFAAIGNQFLLDAPNILQVQCSRALFAYARAAKCGGGMKIVRNEAGVPLAAKTTSEFKAKRDELLAAAKHGAVLASPCISDGEREIVRLAFADDASVIALRNMGFAPLYKPGGKLFDRAADGKLLLLAPIAWPYTPADKPMTRFDACVLNRLAQLIAGDGAVEINYKGVKPLEIDRLVRTATTAKGEKI